MRQQLLGLNIESAQHRFKSPANKLAGLHWFIHNSMSELTDLEEEFLDKGGAPADSNDTSLPPIDSSDGIGQFARVDSDA